MSDRQRRRGGRERVGMGAGVVHLQHLRSGTFVPPSDNSSHPAPIPPAAAVRARDVSRRALARSVRQALRARPDAASQLPAAAAYGRFPDIASLDRAARLLGQDPCAWHPVYLASLPPEALEAALPALLGDGERACAVRAVRSLGRALRLSGAADTRQRATYWLAVLDRRPGRPRQLRRLRQVIGAAAQQGDRARIARALAQLGRVYAMTGRMHDAFTRLTASIELGDGADAMPPSVLASALNNLGLVLVLTGNAERSYEAYARSREVCVRAGLEELGVVARDGLRYVEEQRGNLAQSYLHASAVLSWRRRAESPARVHRGLVTLARLAADLEPGSDNALELLAEASQLPGDPMPVLSARLCEADVRISRGETEAAVRITDEVGAELSDQPGAPGFETIRFHLYYSRAELLARTGNVSGAYEWYRAAVDLLREPNRRNPDVAPWLRRNLMASLTEAALQVGRSEEAAALVSAAERAAQPDPLPDVHVASVVRDEIEFARPAGELPPANLRFLPPRRP